MSGCGAGGSSAPRAETVAGPGLILTAMRPPRPFAHALRNFLIPDKTRPGLAHVGAARHATPLRHCESPLPIRLGLSVLRVLRLLFKPVPVCRIDGVPIQIHPTCLLYPIGVMVWMAW